MKTTFTREQRGAMILAILILILITVVLQLWLLAATMNSYLGAMTRSSGRPPWSAWCASE
jgi:hypothetical protein